MPDVHPGERVEVPDVVRLLSRDARTIHRCDKRFVALRPLHREGDATLETSTGSLSPLASAIIVLLVSISTATNVL